MEKIIFKNGEAPYLDQENLNKMQENFENALNKKEEWKMLIPGIEYRKVGNDGNDVEISIKATDQTKTYNGNTVTELGTLPSDYRPKSRILVPLYAVSATEAFSNLRLIIMETGVINIQNLISKTVTPKFLSTFIKYSIL